MYPHISLALAFASTLLRVKATPLPVANPTPELELLRRQGLATVYDSCTVPNTVAITFDDGPYIYESEIVDYLDSQGVKATFFVNGNNWRCIYDDGAVSSLKKAFASGHQIGSHTWAHLDLSQQSWDKIHDEMWRVELALTRILGVSPAFMRPPYGDYNDLVRQASSIRGQSLVLWDFDSGDSVGASVQESENNYSQVANQRPDTLLALNHETYETTARQVIEFAIPLLKSKGYNLVTVAECLGQNPYQFQQAPQSRDSSWTC